MIIPWLEWSLSGGLSSNRIKDAVFVELVLIHEIKEID